MDNLWAPWRMEYIGKGDKPKVCIFCAEALKNDPKLLVYADKLVTVRMNKYPYSNAHLLVAPVTHTPSLAGLEPDASMALIGMVAKAIEILKVAFKPEGFNVGLNLGKAAGAGIDEHLHFHIVPRWNGDTNFMTVTADVRVIPEHIITTANKLRPYFNTLKNENRKNKFVDSDENGITIIKHS